MSAVDRAVAEHERMTPLERLRRSIDRHEIDDKRSTGWESDVAWNGPDSCPTPAVRGAFLKGWAAAAAGESAYSNPYDEHNRATRGDRRGRYNAGFRPVYRRAWALGHAWAIERRAAEPFDDYVLLQALAGETWDGRSFALATSDRRRRR